MTVIGTSTASVTESPRFNQPAVVRMMLGHGAADFYQAAVPALVPFFIATYHLSQI